MRQLVLRDLSTGPPKNPAAANSFDVNHFPCVVGRHSTCDFRLDHPFVSRRHCALFERDGQVWVQDLGSHNGTYVNRERVEGAQALRDGDILYMAHLPFQVQLESKAEVLAVEPDSTLQLHERPPERQRVLVVEDNEDAAETLAMILRDRGHEVQVAHDGPEAIQVAKAQQPDAVLVDIRLPGMDGYEVAQRLRRQAGLEKTRLVAITGYEREKSHERSREAGFDHLLVKPVRPECLEEALTGSA